MLLCFEGFQLAEQTGLETAHNNEREEVTNHTQYIRFFLFLRFSNTFYSEYTYSFLTEISELTYISL